MVFVKCPVSSREAARRETTNFDEVFVKCPVEICIERDLKGLYKMAIEEEIKNFTGVSQPYEDSPKSEIIVENAKETEESSTQKVLDYLICQGLIYSNNNGSGVLRPSQAVRIEIQSNCMLSQ